MSQGERRGTSGPAETCSIKIVPCCSDISSGVISLREYLELIGEFRVARNLVSVVDDDESIRRTTTLLIESFGFRAAAFETAEDFLKSGQLHDASCLIVDVQMPGMNGLQLQSHLAAADCGIPIIFMTAYDDKESRRRAMQSGAAAFLGKPFSDEQLLQTIRSTLRPDKGDTKTT